jgi:hypothetical protein
MTETSEALLRQIGENVDRLVTIDALSYGVIGRLYEAARVAHEIPLSLKAARLLIERAGGGTVLITTGLILPGHHPYGETDGPVGTVVLGRALALGVNVKVLVVTEPELCGLLSALLRTAELQVVAAEDFRRDTGAHRPVACVLPQSRSEKEAARQAAEYLEDFGVGAVVAIEKNGANAQGVYHMVGGIDISDQVSKSVTLFTEAAKRGIPTIGIGDRGNELGFGPAAEAVRKLLPFGTDCGCPCHGGVADQTPADLTFPAVVSNWGAYGIAACLAALIEDPELIHSPDLERELFRTAVREGGVDGMSGRVAPAADGIGVDVSAAVVTLLHEIYRARSARRPSPFSTPLLGPVGEAKGAKNLQPNGSSP